VVGIGVSAGGYEAFSKFLEKLPADTGMAFVLVQHLGPDHDSKLTELLARNTSLQENKIEGAVIALLNIDELKRSVEQISEIIWEPFLAMDHELRVVKASETFFKTFRVESKATEGKFLFELGNGQWNIPGLRTLLNEVLPRQTRVLDFPVDHDFPDLGRRKILLNARRLDSGSDGKDMILLAFRDVTGGALPS
jgi:hypothetical protein